MTKRFNRLPSIFAAGSLLAALVVLAFVPFNMGGCNAGSVDVTSIVQGTQQLGKSVAMSEKDEPALGQSVAVQATNRYPLYHDQALTRYVTLVGRVVGASSARPDIVYYFGILDTDKVNAFSGPHGYVFITRGALMRMHDESELAAVLGHEIGHICKQHGLAAVKSATFTQGALKVASGASKEAAAFGNASDALSNIVLNVGFSEPQEDEADAQGVKYAIAAGYNPDGYLHFLQRLLKEQGAGGKPFDTHPGLGDRVKRVAIQIAKASASGQGASLEDRFKATVVLR
jgi:predicted Zn-dependent protease